MIKFKVNKVLEELKAFTNITKTKYDELFEQKIISRGRSYYDNNKIIEFKCVNNICEAIVEGTNNYNVKIINNGKVEVHCSCPYHESNTYCKHIYAVLYKIHMDEIMLLYKNVIENNINTIKEVIDEIKNNLSTNEKLVLKKDKKLALQEITRVEEFLFNVDIENKKFGDIKYLEYKTENETEIIIEYYKRFNEYLDRRKKQIEQRKLDRLEEKRLEQESLEYEDDADDPLIQKLDSYIESMPMKVLKQARLKTIEDNEDTSILDKAIKNKKQKEQELRRKNRKSLFGMFIHSLLFDNKKTSKQDDKFSDYEPYNFEEQELEEDDFHYDDLD